jgi:ribose/xylose/arabinose/galactoside ABC-type transport system permease subunit
MSAITLTVQQYGLVMPMPAAGSNGTSYDNALSMHNQSLHALMTTMTMICCICAQGHEISTSSVMTTMTTTTSTMTRRKGTTSCGTTTALHMP